MLKRVFQIGMWLAAGLVAFGGSPDQSGERPRLGETIEQCDQRYGTPQETGSSGGRDGYVVPYTYRGYNKDGIGISVSFVDGKAVEILYTAQTAVFSAEKVLRLIRINQQGRIWTLPVKDTLYKPSDVTTFYYYSSDGAVIEWNCYGKEALRPYVTFLKVSAPAMFPPQRVAKNKNSYQMYGKAGEGSIDGL